MPAISLSVPYQPLAFLSIKNGHCCGLELHNAHCMTLCITYAE